MNLDKYVSLYIEGSIRSRSSLRERERERQYAMMSLEDREECDFAKEERKEYDKLNRRFILA